MLVRPDATYFDDATKRLERVFPQGADWLSFASEFPASEVFANSVLDPSIGVGGSLGVKTFAAADWRNWTKSIQIGLFEIGTRVGIPPLESKSVNEGLSLVYSTLHTTVSAFQNSDNPAELIPELVKNVAMQVINQVLKSNVVTMVVAEVIQVATWAFNVAQSVMEENLGKNISMPPMQTEDPATDTWQVNRVFEMFRSRGSGGIVYPDGEVVTASNANYTKLFLPAYLPSRRWQLQMREKGVAAQQGTAEAVGATGHSGGYKFDAGDASTFGFMPGTTVMLRVLQASYRFYYSTRGTPVDRYTLRCKGVDKPCWKSVKTFNGKRNCRQCVDAESVWPVQGLGWAYGGAPINATTPGENVGAFYPSANKLILNILDMIAQPGPLLYTVDCDLMNTQWKMCFEQFWEFAHREWGRYSGYGWRGLISRLATLMTAFEHDGELRVGGRDAHMPLKLINSPREGKFKIDFKHSIYNRLIKPYCTALYKMQRHYLDTFQVAYIPPGAGAVYTADGSVRKTKLADDFLAARRNLLSSTKRMLIDLRQVSDPEYRKELAKAGVKPSPVNQALHGSPGVSGHEILKPDIKPRRVPARPKVSRASPMGSMVELVERAKQAELKVTKPKPRPKRAKPRPAKPKPVSVATPTEGSSSKGGVARPGVAVGVVVGSAAVTAAALAGLHKATEDEVTEE